MAIRILAIIPIIEDLIEGMENRLIIPVVTINILTSLINIPHAIIILIREIRRRANRILVVWKELEEGNIIVRLSKVLCLQYRNNYRMVGSVMPRTSKLLFMWRI